MSDEATPAEAPVKKVKKPKKVKKVHVEVIQLKGPTNVSYKGPKGRMTGCVLPMSIYRGRMAQRVYDLIEDKSLLTVIE